MKVKVLSYDEASRTAVVQFTPTRLGRIFGREQKTVEFIYTGEIYLVGDDMKWYYKETGEIYGRLEKLDNFVRMGKFKKK